MLYVCSFLTKAYAKPAPAPPAKPTSAGSTFVNSNDGLMMNKAPEKAVISEMMEQTEGFSERNRKLAKSEKNGDILLSMAASEMFRWSIA